MLENLKLQAQRDNHLTPLYIHEYYNIVPCYSTSAVRHTIARIANAVIEELNKHDCLPKIMLIMLDADLLRDLDVFDDNSIKDMKTVTSWLMRQLNMIVRRRRASLLEKKPGAIYTGDPKMIFVRMIRRIDKYQHGTKLDQIYGLRSKFNDHLNDMAAQIEQLMLTINSCNTSGHFDRWGNLSQKGKTDLWYEVDDLIERFDIGKVKLLPAPKIRFRQTSFKTKRWGSDDDHSNKGKRRKLPTPPYQDSY